MNHLAAAAAQELPEPFRSTIVMSLKGATLDEIRFRQLPCL